MSVEIVTGAPGAGKTLYLMRQMFKDRKKAKKTGVKQITNIKVNTEYFPDVLYIPTEEMTKSIYTWVDKQQHTGSFIYITEGGVIWPSMDYKNIPKKIILALVEHRHNGFQVMIDCQSFEQLTTGIRRVCQYCTEIDGWNVLRFSTFNCYGVRNGKVNYKDKFNRGLYFHHKYLYESYNTHGRIEKPQHLDIESKLMDEI